MGWIFKNKKTPSKAPINRDFVKNKIALQAKNKKAFFIVLFLAGFFLFAPSSKTMAAEHACKFATGTSLNNYLELGGDANGTIITYDNCCELASKAQGFIASEGCIRLDTRTAVVPATNDVKITDEGTTNFFVRGIKWMLIGVLTLVGWLFAIAATLFSWIIEPNNISGPTGVLNSPVVKDVWIMVRDLLNMAFILVLLFAAFCTIFQVSKWNLKKVWLNILINALLVNFSFPIARFFIDVSNVAFYYFVNNLFTTTSTVTGSSIFALLGSSSGIGNMLAPQGYEAYNVSYLIAMIVVVFIMGMTLCVIAALFVVRLIALIMLVMFSPVGFVGYIFPSTASYADDWWKKLFSNAFFAPIMIFFIAVSQKVTEAIGTSNMQSFNANASANTVANQSNWIAQAAFLFIPIIILWMGIGVAKSLGIEGASKVVDNVKKGGKWLANSPGHYSGIYGGTKKGWSEMRKSGSFLGMNNMATRLAFKSGVADREAKFAGLMEGGRDGLRDAKRDINRKGANEIREAWKKAGGASNSELDSALKGSQIQRMAAALEMSEKNGFKLNETDTPAQVLKRYQEAAKAVSEDKVFQNNFNDKVKEKHIKLVIEDEIETKEKESGTKFSPLARYASYEHHLNKLSAEGIAKQKGIHADEELHYFLKNKASGGKGGTKNSGAKSITNAAEKLSQADREEWKKGGVPI